MELFDFFKSIVEQDTSAVVICNVDHKIIYMNPAACERYGNRGGASLVGRSLLDCHNSRSNELIVKVLNWFSASRANDRVHMYFNEKENKDVYMVALRKDDGELIGYYEKHEYRDRDMSPLYCMN